MKKKDLIINFVEEKIKQGVWVQGTKIFSENQFIDYLHVSRNTVRDALKELNLRGIVEAVPNSGYFIKKAVSAKKEFILIITNEHALVGDLRNSNRILIEKLKTSITSAGYKPICYVNTNTMTIKDSLSEILDNMAGIISIGLYNTEFAVFDNMNIPIVVPLRANATEYPSVMIDYLTYMKKLYSLTEKYDPRKTLALTYGQIIKNFYRGYWDIFSLYGVENLFEKYDLRKLVIPKNNSYKNKQIKEIFSELDYKPECIIFVDDNIFTQTVPLFEKYPNIFRDTDIITQTTEETFIPEGYRITGIEINMEEFAKSTVRLLTKLINREFIKKYNIYIAPNIIQ